MVTTFEDLLKVLLQMREHSEGPYTPGANLRGQYLYFFIFYNPLKVDASFHTGSESTENCPTMWPIRRCDWIVNANTRWVCLVSWPQLAVFISGEWMTRRTVIVPDPKKCRLTCINDSYRELQVIKCVFHEQLPYVNMSESRSDPESVPELNHSHSRKLAKLANLTHFFVSL